MIVLFALGACRHEPPPPLVRAGVVEVARGQGAGERDGILRVLNGAAPAPCYEAALGRDPRSFGELVVRFEIDAAGVPTSTRATFSTLEDADAERCVLDVVAGLRFPAPSRPGLSVAYPFLFTSDATPPEVTRALKLRYKLVAEDMGPLDDPKAKAPPGVVLVW